jgi:hypothetical protein
VGLLSVMYGPYDDEAEAALLRYNSLDLDVCFYKALNGSYENRIRGYRGADDVWAPPARIQRDLNYWLEVERVVRNRPCAHLKWGFTYYLADGRSTPCCVLSHDRYAAPEWSRARLLERYQRGQMPEECLRCSNFARA